MDTFYHTTSRVAACGGVPALFINGKPFPAAAYMTYLEEYNAYAAFAAAGYRLFSVPVLCAGRWISATELFKPFHSGIFDRKGEPDFSSLDASVRRILDARPDAYIFPRLNLSMPLWWIREHPESVDGTGKRELLFSRAYRDTAAKMLRAVIEHANGSDYADRIAGWHLAGGNTEEWFHFDMNAGLCENAAPCFAEYLKTRRPEALPCGLPDPAAIAGTSGALTDPRAALYLEFSNRAVAETVCLLAREAKAATGGKKAVGAFYGYSLEVTSPLYGTHALKTLLRCPDVDFISSPNSYIGVRDEHADWTEMYPADSVRLHGKLCLQECDIRTHLTRLLGDAAPEYDPGRHMTAEIWRGVQTPAHSVRAIRKTFCRQLIKGNGFWWFDMWGGWYNDPALLEEMRRCLELSAAALEQPDRGSAAQLAVFTDEDAYMLLPDGALRSGPHAQRKALGCMGAPYDIYDISDFEAVYRRYRAVIFISGPVTAAVREAARRCEARGTPYLAVCEQTPLFSSGRLRAFCKECGVHVYCDTDDLLYVSKNLLALYAAEAGEKTVRLKTRACWRELLPAPGDRGCSDTLTFRMEAGETKLFALERTE